MGHYIGTDSLLCALVYLSPMLAITFNAIVWEVCESDEDTDE